MRDDLLSGNYHRRRRREGLHYQNFEIPNTLFGRDGDLIFHVI
jgi:hypothetical protein